MLARAFQDDPAWGWVLPGPAPARRAAALALPDGLRGRRGRRLDDRRLRSRCGALASARTLHRCVSAAALFAFVSTPVRLREATPRFLAYGRARRSRPSAFAQPPGRTGTSPESASIRPSSAKGSARLSSRPVSRAPPATGFPASCSRTPSATSPFYRHHDFEVVLRGREAPPGAPTAWARWVRNPGRRPGVVSEPRQALPQPKHRRRGARGGRAAIEPGATGKLRPSEGWQAASWRAARSRRHRLP